MRRLCVFYRLAYKFLGLKVEWIVCKKCQAELRRGKRLRATFEPGWPELARMALEGMSDDAMFKITRRRRGVRRRGRRG